MGAKSDNTKARTGGTAAAGGNEQAPGLGARLREAREAKGIGVRELGRRVEVSGSFISQIELGRVMPSVATLYEISSEIGASLDYLFSGVDSVYSPAATDGAMGVSQEEWEAQHIQRGGKRKSLSLPGVTWDLLAPTGVDGIEFLYVTYAPGGESTSENHLIRHEGVEHGWVESGRLEVSVGFRTCTLEPGDAILFPSTVPHRLSNPSLTEPATGIWVVVGRDSDPRGPKVAGPEPPSRRARATQKTDAAG